MSKHEIYLPEMIRVMKAAKDGSRIEFACLPYSDDDVDEDLIWEYGPNPCWDWNNYLYREEKTAPASQLDRIKAEYTEYEVVELKWDNDMLLIDRDNRRFHHISPQSMKGFYRYVYQDEDGLYIDIRPVLPDVNIHPVAVLLTK